MQMKISKKQLIIPVKKKIDAQVANGTLYRADGLEELAEQVGVDPAVFVQTIKDYLRLVIKLPVFNIFTHRSPRSLPLYQRLLCFLLGLFL